MKEKIVNLLLKELNHIYCNNCIGEEEGDIYSRCNECHRKNMRWEASKEFCEEIVDKIIGVIG